MTDQNEENYEEQSPPPSQPRPAKNNQSLSNRQNERENGPPKQDLPKRGLKRKHVDHSAMEAKIAKTEQSIEKLEKHLTNRTFPVSLQYSMKPNITPDSIFDREIKEIKQRAQHSLVQALTSFHKRRLESLTKRASNVLSVRKNKHVNRQPLKRMHSSNIVNNRDDEIANLRNDVTDLKELLHALVNKNDGRYNSVFSDSKKAAFKNSPKQTKSIRRKERRITSRCTRSAKERETNENFLNNLSNRQLTDNQPCYKPQKSGQRFKHSHHE